MVSFLFLFCVLGANLNTRSLQRYITRASHATFDSFRLWNISVQVMDIGYSTYGPSSGVEK